MHMAGTAVMNTAVVPSRKKLLHSPLWQKLPSGVLGGGTEGSALHLHLLQLWGVKVFWQRPPARMPSLSGLAAASAEPVRQLARQAGCACEHISAGMGPA